ncbi:Holliday junction recognition protein isoform X2 [Sphaerodactylus townsendi]|uniref:Holliday junction recognition protein isoform X2 n=1 Tax=Sphaerodactylus townsendi TaxID=933632 RepID=UPI002026CED4|nr:Holliday junction recognition protein isoform X2 [Sphaerodactylus townsendi]
MSAFLPVRSSVDGGNRGPSSMAMRDGGGIWGKEERDRRHRPSRRKEERDERRRCKRRDSGGGSSYLDRLLDRSRRRFALSMSSIVEKYNFPFEDDKLISIKSLMYDTPDGPKTWGEESEEESMNSTHESPERKESMNSYEESPSGTDYKNNSEMLSIKRYLENMHLKNIHPECCSGAEMDLLVNDDAYTVSESPMIGRTESKNIHEESSFHELTNEPLYGQHAVVPRKQGQNGHSESTSLQLGSCITNGSPDEMTAFGHLSLGENGKTDYSSFLETYESADQHCSWNNITIADLYPEMVKTFSRLMNKIPHKTSFRSQSKRYEYGYWQPKKTKFNAATERVRKSGPLKHNSVLAIRKENEKCKLPMENSGSSRLLGYGNSQKQHTFLTESRVTSPAYHKADKIEMDSSDIEDYSSVERVGQNGIGAIIFPNNFSKTKIFNLESSSWIPSSSDYARKSQPFEELSTGCPNDSGATFDLTERDESGVGRIMQVKAPSYLNFYVNSNMNPYLQADKSSPVKSPCRLFKNHEIKFFPTASSLRRSRSFSQFLVNHNRIKVQQKSEDAFEKMYKELCCPQFQKSFKLSNVCPSPTQSGNKLLKPDWMRFHQKESQSGNMHVKSHSEGFPNIPTFLRAARLKKYEGVQVSHTVNALVNSPVRTLPSVARTKRTANFSSEDFLSSPVKRLKNISESFASRVHQKPPDWGNINLDKSGMTHTLHSPNSSNWSSKKLDSGFCVSLNRTFLVGPSTYIRESGSGDNYEYIPKLLHNCDSLKRMQNCSRGVSKKLNYIEETARETYVEEHACKDYLESFSEGSGDEMS